MTDNDLLSRRSILLGGGATLLLGGCSTFPRPNSGSRLIPASDPRTIHKAAYARTTPDMSTFTIYDDSGRILMTLHTDGLNITATNNVTNQVVMQFTRGDLTASVTSPRGTASFNSATPNAPATYHLLGGTQTVADTVHASYLAPNSTSVAQTTRVIDAQSNSSTSVYQPRFSPYTHNSYSDYGWAKIASPSGVGGGTGCGRVCPQNPTGPGVHPRCLGQYVELAVMAVALTTLEAALVALEAMTAGLATLVVVAIEALIFAYYTYLINQLMNCLQQ